MQKRLRLPGKFSCCFATYVFLNLLLASVTTTSHAQVAVPTVALRLSKPEIMDSEHTDLKVTLTLPNRQERSVISVMSDSGIRVTPSTTDIQGGQGTIIRHFDVVGDRRVARPGQYTISVDLSLGAAGSATTVASESIVLKYSRRIPFWAYLVWGTIGIVVGYILRLLTKVLASVPAPAPAPPTNDSGSAGSIPTGGPITRFVLKHYYKVELFVTCLLGFLALLALAKSGMAPDGATYWYGALLLGVPLGLLTNTDLILRIRS